MLFYTFTITQYRSLFVHEQSYIKFIPFLCDPYHTNNHRYCRGSVIFFGFFFNILLLSIPTFIHYLFFVQT